MEENKGGFSSAGPDGIVRCSSCNIEVKALSSDSSKEIWSKIHIKVSPFCKNAKGLPEFSKMKGFTASSLCVDAKPTAQLHARIKKNLSELVPAKVDARSGFFLPKEMYPNHKAPMSRQNTFRNFNGVIKSDDFVAAGFFLNPSPRSPPDKVTCFWCDGSLDGWNAGEIPIDEHAKYYPGCAYIRQQKGTNFIFRIQAGMTVAERGRANNLDYSPNPEILYEYYSSYGYADVRKRTLEHRGLPERDAFLFAIEGFYYDDDTDFNACYYCGMRMSKDMDLATMKQIHMQNSRKCLENRGGDSSGSVLDSPEEYVICSPCGHVVDSVYYNPDQRRCPRCTSELKSLTKVSNHRGRITTFTQNM